MAERPVFIPLPDGNRLVQECPVEFHWHAGMADSQKRKNVLSLHESAARRGLSPLLEISSKSEDRVGQRMSAFSLKVKLAGREIALENAFQGSKVFRDGGPYSDLYEMEPRAAKSDTRLRDSGPLIGFHFDEDDYPIYPQTVFYDWLYISALYPHMDYLKNKIYHYKGFTDIVFNPLKSINCQARSCATLVAMDKQGVLSKAMSSFSAFLEIMIARSPLPTSDKRHRQPSLM